VSAIILASTTTGALLATWYGRKTLGRIQLWGERMNEIDAIYQSVAAAEEITWPDGTSSITATCVSTGASSRRHAPLTPGVSQRAV